MAEVDGNIWENFKGGTQIKNLDDIELPNKCVNVIGSNIYDRNDTEMDEHFTELVRLEEEMVTDLFPWALNFNFF